MIRRTNAREKTAACDSLDRDDGGYTPAARFLVPLSIEIPVRSPTALMDGKTSRGAFSIYLALGDSLGLVGDVTQRTQPFGTGDMQHAKDGLFRYEFGLLTDGRISRIAVGVYDEVTREYGLQRVDLPLPARG